MKIGIFDSGVGGLTVLKKILEEKPKNEYLYFGDTIHLPYGNKTKEELRTYAQTIIQFFEEQNVDQIIVACGTVSSTLDGELKAVVPLLDVMNPTVRYLKDQHVNSVGLIATERTIEGKIFENKLRQEGIQVSAVACPMFVPLIEMQRQDSKECQQAIRDCIRKLNPGIEQLILGCTHYPLLEDQLQKVLDCPTFNMATPISKQIEEGTTASIHLYFSYLDETIKENVEHILGKQVPIEEYALENNA